MVPMNTTDKQKYVTAMMIIISFKCYYIINYKVKTTNPKNQFPFQ